MEDWTHPNNLKSFHGILGLTSYYVFLGLTCYYRNFVKNYGKIVAPLTSPLKNNAFVWSEVAK
jgi:hypothetical protein